MPTITVAATKHGAAASGELVALPAGLPSERRALAEAMRSGFATLGMSMGEFAAACHRDKGAISRYLSGKRVPPREFVDELLQAMPRPPGAATADGSVAERFHDLHI